MATTPPGGSAGAPDMTPDVFVQHLQTAFDRVRLERPGLVRLAQERLDEELEPHGIRLTYPILTALAFSIVQRGV